MARVVYGDILWTAELEAAGGASDIQIAYAGPERMSMTQAGGDIVAHFWGQFQVAAGMVTGGVIQAVDLLYRGQSMVQMSGLQVSYADLMATGDLDSLALRGDDQIYGSIYGDGLWGGDGADFMLGLDGDDDVLGEGGDDDINGNIGADHVFGGDGDDWVRGGKDNDTIYGDAGNDPHVNGNIGNDSVSGGIGADTLYGGQDNDSLFGDSGADLLSGDLGVDRLTGGLGADRFVLRAGTGADVVTDFSAASGDRIQLAPGVVYTTAVNGSGHTVISLADASLTLTGVTTFSADWIAFA